VTTVSVKHSTPSAPPAPDLAAIKSRQQATWASGDFAVIGTTLSLVGESLCEAADLRAGQAVLDVACGNGTATLSAARRYCKVTGLDYVPSLLAQAEERARAERLEIAFVEGDAEELPFRDGQFDAAISTFGVMFTPDHGRAARELARVVRPGGKIGLASWTPDGSSASCSPWWGAQPAARRPQGALALGDRPPLRAALRGRRGVHPLDAARVQLPLPVGRALHRRVPEVLRADPQALRCASGGEGCDLHRRSTDLIGRFNRADDGTMVVPSKYLELVVTRR
jgi:SAM-dependent methyltransferase